MKKTILVLTIMMALISLVAVFPGSAMAQVTGPCVNCHTMHNSQGGTDPLDMKGDSVVGPNATLLTNSCVGCHSHPTQSTYTVGGTTVPVVLNTGGTAPATYLAGGNFWWVKQGLGGDDTKGHNVFLGEPDEALSAGAPGYGTLGCGANGSSCHLNLNTVAELSGSFLDRRQGCTKCHMVSDTSGPKGFHHKNDTGPVVDTEAEGYYRFLHGHMAGQGNGVAGIEDPDWQATSSSTDHNEYLGNSGNKLSSGSMSLLGNTMTGYCSGCHGNFHQQQTSGDWVRHPSDAVLPDETPDSEYEAYTVYDPNVPVARASTSLTAVSGTVTKGSDMVMCLSCHRPHGSPYPDMLRWNYDAMEVGTDGAAAGTGCFVCHTGKDGA